MVINGSQLLIVAPIRDMLTEKVSAHGVSHGLGEVGYDIRIKQQISFRGGPYGRTVKTSTPNEDGRLAWFEESAGRFVLASAMELFQMPDQVMGIVHDKSTWARQGLSVFNTVIEPGWHGYLTLELVYHGERDLVIPAGAGIAQVVFHELAETAVYRGKYQHQEDGPVAAKRSL